jgi:nucleoside-diphosphate kinase
MRMCALSRAEAEEFYGVHAGKPFFERLVDFMSSGRIVAMELVAEDAIATWRALIGPTDSNTARATAPDSLRAAFGTDNTRNACHGSDAPDTAAAEAAFFFGKGRQTVGHLGGWGGVGGAGDGGGG